jgi:hypothetical protein
VALSVLLMAGFSGSPEKVDGLKFATQQEDGRFYVAKICGVAKHILCDTSRMPLLTHSLPITRFLVATPEHH